MVHQEFQLVHLVRWLIKTLLHDLFMPIINYSLSFLWSTNRTQSAINKTPAILHWGIFSVNCICKTRKRFWSESKCTKIVKYMRHDHVCNHTYLWDWSCKTRNHIEITMLVRKTFQKHTQCFCTSNIYSIIAI